MFVILTSGRKMSHATKHLYLRFANVNVAWNWGSPGLSGRRQAASRGRHLGARRAWVMNGKVPWVATGSHGGHFMCWAQLQNSSNSNLYSHFLNTKSFLLPTYDCSEAKCTLQPYQNKFGKHMEENYWVTVTEPGRLIHEWKAGTYSSCLVRLF